MPKAKISISIDEAALAKLEAVKTLEHRGSVSNTIEALLNFSRYEFIDTASKTDIKPACIAKLKENPFETTFTVHGSIDMDDVKDLHKPMCEHGEHEFVDITSVHDSNQLVERCSKCGITR